MAQHRPFPTSEHSSHPARLDSNRTMADRVGTRVDRAQQAPLDPPIDFMPAHPQLQQLTACDRPVLPSRKLSHRVIDMPKSTFARSRRGDVDLVGHAPEADRRWRTCGAHKVTKASRATDVWRETTKTRLQPAVAASSFDPFQ